MDENLQTLIHTWDLIEEERPNIALVGNIRLDPVDGTVKLKADAFGDYPTTGDSYIMTPLFNPGAVRQWVGFQADVTHVKDSPSNSLTGVGFRLHDGTDQWWWDGAAWAQSTADWNTEADIANNIGSFAPTTRKLRVVIRLTTTDKRYTPTLYRAKVAWTGRVFWIEDLLYRSLSAYLKEIKAWSDFAFKVPMPGGFSLNLGAAIDKLGLTMDIDEVESVFNNTLDPDNLDNLLDSYDANTRIATLSTAIPVGNFARARARVQPEVAIQATDDDYHEVAKVPAIIATDFEDVASSPLAAEDSVVNRDTFDLIRLPAPYRFDVRFSMILLSPNGIDQSRLHGSVVEYMETNPILRSVATDRRYTIQMLDEMNMTTKAAQSGLNSSRMTVVIRNVLAFNKPAVYEKAVSRFVVGGDADVILTP